MANLLVDENGNIVTLGGAVLSDGGSGDSGGLPVVNFVSVEDVGGQLNILISSAVPILVGGDGGMFPILVDKATGLEDANYQYSSWKGDNGFIAVAGYVVPESWVRIVDYNDHNIIYGEGTIPAINLSPT